jgi:hypothetical protein
VEAADLFCGAERDFDVLGMGSVGPHISGEFLYMKITSEI